MDDVLPMPPDGGLFQVFPKVGKPFRISSRGNGFFIEVRKPGFFMTFPPDQFETLLPYGHHDVGRLGPFKPKHKHGDVLMLYYEDADKVTYVTLLEIREHSS